MIATRRAERWEILGLGRGSSPPVIVTANVNVRLHERRTNYSELKFHCKTYFDTLQNYLQREDNGQGTPSWSVCFNNGDVDPSNSSGLRMAPV
ncbi:unnamed protein product [Heligmosomoides polygyrus]|uniref:BTB/POZ domain-containing protein n=1 Tax=Heligmosomoides polygyrus TaxID=6339 RepID=A0A183GFI7_HELPZ|nr:unnamed protein product [Heligmosomoides polygyrus]